MAQRPKLLLKQLSFAAVEKGNNLSVSGKESGHLLTAVLCWFMVWTVCKVVEMSSTSSSYNSNMLRGSDGLKVREANLCQFNPQTDRINMGGKIEEATEVPLSNVP